MNARASVGEGPLDKGVQKAAAQVAQGALSMLQLLILCVLWMVKEHIPMIKLPSMLALMVVVGVDMGALSHKYNHHRYFMMVLRLLSKVILCAQLAAIRQSPYFSIMADSSTDVSGEDHILFYVQYL